MKKEFYRTALDTLSTFSLAIASNMFLLPMYDKFPYITASVSILAGYLGFRTSEKFWHYNYE